MRDKVHINCEEIYRESVDSQTLPGPEHSQHLSDDQALPPPGEHFEIHPTATLSAGLSSDQSCPAKSCVRGIKRKQTVSEGTDEPEFRDPSFNHPKYDASDDPGFEGDIEDAIEEVQRPWVYLTPDRNIDCLWPARKRLKYVPCVARFRANIFDNAVDQPRYFAGTDSSSCSSHIDTTPGSVFSEATSVSNESCTDTKSEEPYGPEEPGRYPEHHTAEACDLDTPDSITIYYNVDNNDFIVGKGNSADSDEQVGGLNCDDEHYEWVDCAVASSSDNDTSSGPSDSDTSSASGNSDTSSGSSDSDTSSDSSDSDTSSGSSDSDSSSSSSSSDSDSSDSSSSSDSSDSDSDSGRNNGDVDIAYLNNYVCREEMPPRIKRRRRKKKKSVDKVSTSMHVKRRHHRCPSTCICRTGKSKRVPEMVRRPGFRVLEPLYNRVLKLQTINRTNIQSYKCCEKRCSLRRWRPVNIKRLKKDYHKSDLRVCRYSWGDWKGEARKY